MLPDYAGGSLVNLVASVVAACGGKPHHPILAVATTTAHLAAVGVWLFAIAAGIVAGRSAVRTLGALSPYAVAAAALVGLTGVLDAALQLSSPAQLAGTGWPASRAGDGGGSLSR